MTLFKPDVALGIDLGTTTGIVVLSCQDRKLFPTIVGPDVGPIYAHSTMHTDPDMITAMSQIEDRLNTLLKGFTLKEIGVESPLVVRTQPNYKEMGHIIATWIAVLTKIHSRKLIHVRPSEWKDAGYNREVMLKSLWTQFSESKTDYKDLTAHEKDALGIGLYTINVALRK